MAGDYEPEDSRNVTGTSANQTGDRWSGKAGSAANVGQMGTGQDNQFAGQIREHMEVIGADGAHVGTVDHVDGDRIKLTKTDSSAGFGGAHDGHHHYIPLADVSGVEGNQVRLSSTGATAYGNETEESGMGTNG